MSPLPLSLIRYAGWEASLSVTPPREMELDPSEPPLPFCQVGNCQRFPDQYACACPPTSVPSPHSSPHISSAILVHQFNHHPCIFCCPCRPAYMSHLCSYPPCLLPPSSPCLFFSLTYTHSWPRTFFSLPGRGCCHPSPQKLFYYFLFVPTLFCFSSWQTPANVASSAIVCPFWQVGIQYPTRHNYRGAFQVLSSGPPSTIISPSSHHLCLPPPSFSVPHRPAYQPHIHPPPPSPSSQNIRLVPSPLLFSSSIMCLHLSVFYHQFHPCQTPCVFSAAPLPVLLSNTPAWCHHISLTPESLPTFDLHHLLNILSLNPYWPPPSHLA